MQPRSDEIYRKNDSRMDRSGASDRILVGINMLPVTSDLEPLDRRLGVVQELYREVCRDGRGRTKSG